MLSDGISMSPTRVRYFCPLCEAHQRVPITTLPSMKRHLYARHYTLISSHYPVVDCLENFGRKDNLCVHLRLRHHMLPTEAEVDAARRDKPATSYLSAVPRTDRDVGCAMDVP